jgi:hypothetical protein
LGGRLSFLFSFLTCSFSFSETSFFFLLYFWAAWQIEHKVPVLLATSL